MQLYSNNAESLLAAGMASGAASLQVAAGDGAKFPSPTNGDFFLLTVFQRVGTQESNWLILKCTARAGDVLTVSGPLEGTVNRAFNEGDFVALRQTAGSVLPVFNNALTGPLNEAPIVTLASAASMAIAAAGANTFSVTGANAITAFDAAPIGAIRRMTFAAAATLTHSAVLLKLIGGANIVTAAGDWAEFISLGAGNWQMIAYIRATGLALFSDPTRAPLNGTGTSGTWPISVTGSAASITGTNPIANGGTGATTAAGALAALGAYPAANPAAYITSAQAPVQSVNGATGAVTKAQLGVDQVDNTGDANKPVSTAQAAALALKLDKAGGTMTGDIVGADRKITQMMLQDVGYVIVNKGNSGTVTVTFDYSAGQKQKVTATGAHAFAFSGWPPTGNEGIMRVDFYNYGAFTITPPTVTWTNPDGTETTSLVSHFAALAAVGGRSGFTVTGRTKAVFWSEDAGTTVFGKFL